MNLLSLPSAILSLFFFSWVGHAHAAGPIEYIEKKTLALQEALHLPVPWYVTAYQANLSEERWNEAALLCFGREKAKPDNSCFSEEDRISDAMVNRYQYVNKLEIVHLSHEKTPKVGVLFSALFSGGGSGTSRRISIWTYSREKDQFINILPQLSVSNQGEYRIFPMMKNGMQRIFVVADCIINIDQGETHFSPHKYTIKIYRLKDGAFKFAGGYVTKIKYPSLDDTDSIDVIRPELRNIEEYLAGTGAVRS